MKTKFGINAFIALFSIVLLVACPTSDSVEPETSEADPAGQAEPEPASPPTDAGPDVNPNAKAPGLACGCDDDCAGTAENRAVCGYGICMQVAAGDVCSSPGSTTECGGGFRCWPLTQDGPGICWPDCDTHTCEGTCDQDGSCAPNNGATCDGTCSLLCADDDENNVDAGG